MKRARVEFVPKRVQVGDAWWRQKNVKFLGLRFTTEALRLLLKVSEASGFANLRMLPNRYKKDSAQPDFKGFLDFVVPRRIKQK